MTQSREGGLAEGAAGAAISAKGAISSPGSGRRWVLVAFSVALFAVIVWLGGRESWSTVLSGDPWLYLVVFLLTGIAPGLSAWRLKTLVRAATGHDAGPWSRFMHLNMTAIALGLVLPRNAALLGGKAAYLTTMGVPVLRGTWAVLMENVVDLMFLTTIVLPAVLVLVGDLGVLSYLGVTAGLVVVLLGVAFWGRGHDWRGFLGAAVARLPWLASKLPAPASFVPGPTRAVPMLGMTVLIHLSMALRAYVIALAIGLDPSPLVFAAAYPLTQLGLVLAVAPGALGTFDASWLALLILGGVSNSDALSFTVALRACIVVFPVVWYVLSIVMSMTKRSEWAVSNTVGGENR